MKEQFTYCALFLITFATVFDVEALIPKRRMICDKGILIRLRCANEAKPLRIYGSDTICQLWI